MKRSGVRRLFSLSLRRDRWADEVEEEILTHLTIRAERLQAFGMSPQAARDEAIRRFGPLDESRQRLIEAATHREHYMRRQETFAEFRQDLAFAFRTLSRNKGWAAVAVVTLALGIAATTSVWSAATTLLLHPLSYQHADRLAYINLMPTKGNSTGVDVSITVAPKLIQSWRSQSTTMEAIEPYGTETTSLGRGANAETITAARVLPSFLRFAGAATIAGRWFAPDEARKGSGVVVLGENFWQTRYGRAESVIGSTITIEKQPMRVIGIVSATLATPRLGGSAPSVWLPIDSTDEKGFRAVGRLREGARMEQAARDLDSITVRSKFYDGNLPFRASVTPPGKTVSFRDSLVMLTGAVLLVLLVAAANVAHLLLARGLTRRRELAIRGALGASRGRLVRQMLTETGVLTVAGCILGAGLGVAALAILVKFRPPTLPELRLAHVDGVALALVMVASLLCALVFGFIAAAAASGTKQSSGVLRSGAVAAHSRVGERVRSLLVITEMAMSAMLLVGAALLVRTVISLQHTDLGFDPKNLYVVVPDQPAESGVARRQRVIAVRELAEAISTIPGVQSVTATDALPSYRNFAIGVLEIEGRPRPVDQATSFIDVGNITPSYFRTLGATLIAGRLPADSTGSSGAEEIVINAGYARKQWGDASPIGKRLRIVYQGEDNPWLTIVGVVRDISTMGVVGERAAPFLYAPLQESSTPGIVYRTDGREATVAQVLATAKRLFPNSRINTQATEKIIDNSLAPSRFIMSLMAGFTVLTLILAAVGLYGMMSYAVAQRTREIGIRIALGATRDIIARAVVARGALLGAIGAGIGLVLALWATRILESSLYGVSRLDVPSFLIGGAGLLAIAIGACLVPTWRAVRVDPMTSIRTD
jgi:putative ABC transport system permease protein